MTAEVLGFLGGHPGRWTHHVVLTGPEEVDDEITGFLAEAYRFAQAKGRRK